MSALEGVSVDEALKYVDIWVVDSDRNADVMQTLAAEVRRLRSPAPAFDMEAAVEAVAKAICTECGENPVHCGDARGNDYRWQDYTITARAALTAALPFLGASAACDDIQPDMEALRRAARDVCWFDWSGNDCDAVEAICRLRDALAAQAGKQGGGVMADLRNDLAKARDAFFESAAGELLTIGTTQGQYLRNRLEQAFIAGWNARETKESQP